jgi:hypothetical protein
MNGAKMDVFTRRLIASFGRQNAGSVIFTRLPSQAPAIQGRQTRFFAMVRLRTFQMTPAFDAEGES